VEQAIVRLERILKSAIDPEFEAALRKGPIMLTVRKMIHDKNSVYGMFACREDSRIVGEVGSGV
jgi:hypothetical protein